MSTFSSILSSINTGSAQPTTPASTSQRPKLPTSRSSEDQRLANGTNPVAKNTSAGVKRKSEDGESNSRAKAIKLAGNGGSPTGTTPAAQSRFQLSAKSGAAQRPSHLQQVRPGSSGSQPHPNSKPIVKSVTAAGTTSPSTASTSLPQKRGFASIMERAKAAQEAANAIGPASIKHKPVERLTKRERRKMAEEAKALKKAGGRNKVSREEAKDVRRPDISSPDMPEANYKGTTRKPREPLAYKGTMRSTASDQKRPKVQRGQPQDKYGGYASWSDLSDAEDEEEDYDSEGSSDMEGGFDDVEREDLLATRAAQKEDREALEEEERHRREKLERKRKLEALSKSAAAKKRY